MRSTLWFLVGFALAFLMCLPFAAHAQSTVPAGGTGNTSFPLGAFLYGNGTSKLLSTTSPTVGYIHATTGTSTLPKANIPTAISLLGEYITNLTTWFASKADTWLATKSTTNLAEGTNLYYTPARDIRFSTTSVAFWNQLNRDWTVQNRFVTTTTTRDVFVPGSPEGFSVPTTDGIYIGNLMAEGHFQSVVFATSTGASGLTWTRGDGTFDDTAFLLRQPTGNIYLSTNNNTDDASLSITSESTTTASKGFNISDGCYAINGACLSFDDTSFSTTSVDYWETQQTARTADDLTNNSIEDLNDVAAITENYGDIIYWNGSSWADTATSSLFNTATAGTSGLLSSTDWTTFNGKVSASRALTVAGTNGQITSSAGSQDLSADRTWTLSLPSHVIFPGSFNVANATATNATSTTFAATYASSSQSTSTKAHASVFSMNLLYGAGLTACNGDGETLGWANGLFTCGDDDAGSGADGLGTSTNPFMARYFVATSSQANELPYASSTAISVSGGAFLTHSTTTSLGITGLLNIGGDLIGDFVGTGLSLSGTTLIASLGTSITANELASADFGDFTCNGTTCSLDADTVAESELDLSVVTLADFTNDAGFVTSSFSTTSADYWKTVNNFHSTTSVAYQLTQPVILGNATATTFFATHASSTNLNTQNGTSTKFFAAFGTFAQATSTTFSSTFASSSNATSTNLSALFGNITFSTSTAFFATTASSTNLFANVGTFGSSTIGVLTTVGTTTGAKGFDISAGCYAVNGTCLTTSSGTVTNIATTYPVTGGPITNTGTIALAFGTTTNNTWAGTQAFSTLTAANGTITFASTTALTTSGTLYAGTASTSNLTVSAIQSAILSTGTTGIVQSTTISSPLSFSANTLSIPVATGGANGYLASGDWTIFNNKVSTTSIDTIGEVETLWGAINIIAATEIDTCSEFVGIQTQVTGSCGTVALSVSPTFTGTLTFANITGTNATTSWLFATNASSTNSTTTKSYSLYDTTLFASTTALSGTSAFFGTASTSNLTISGVQSALLKTSSTGVVSGASAGTDYQAVISATYPVQFSANVVSLAFGTTTSNTWAGTQAFSTLTATNATLTFASTTALTTSGTVYAGTASTSNLTVSGISSCSGSSALTTNASGAVACGPITAAQVWPFTPTTHYAVNVNSTSTPLFLTNGIFASSTSRFVNLTALGIVTTYATTTYASTTVGTIPNFYSTEATTTRITSTNSTTTNATSTKFFTLYDTTTFSSTTALTVTGSFYTTVTSALLTSNSGGAVSAYAGAANPCTNQVPTTISVAGALGGCTSINNSWWSGTDLSVANGGTGLSTFGGTNHILYTTAADTLASEAAFIYDQSTDTMTLAKLSLTNGTTTTLFATHASTTNATSTKFFASVASSTDLTSLNATSTKFQSVFASFTFATSSSAFHFAGGFSSAPSFLYSIASSSPSALWGFSIATTTVVQNAQFSTGFASSTANLPTVLVVWNGTTTSMAGNTFFYLLQQNTTFIMNSTSSLPSTAPLSYFTLLLCQDGTGGRTVSWANPGSIGWAFPDGSATPTIKTTANTAFRILFEYQLRTGRYFGIATSSVTDPRYCLP